MDIVLLRHRCEISGINFSFASAPDLVFCYLPFPRRNIVCDCCCTAGAVNQQTIPDYSHQNSASVSPRLLHADILQQLGTIAAPL